MEVFRAYCSAVDRNVPVVLKAGAPAPAPDRGFPTLRDPADLVCLDYRVRCTGWCCPLFSVEEDDDAPRLTAPTVAPGPATDRAKESRRWAPPM